MLYQEPVWFVDARCLLLHSEREGVLRGRDLCHVLPVSRPTQRHAGPVEEVRRSG